MFSIKDPAAQIQSMLATGLDPKKFRLGLAEKSGFTVEAIDALIAGAGEVKVVDEHVVAHNRMYAQRAAAKKNPAAWREHNHEEE